MLRERAGNHHVGSGADASEVTVVKVSKWPWYGKGLLNDEADLICWHYPTVMPLLLNVL